MIPPKRIGLSPVKFTRRLPAVLGLETAHGCTLRRIKLACKSLSTNEDCRAYGTLFALIQASRPTDGWHSGEMVQPRRSQSAHILAAAQTSEIYSLQPA